MKVYVDANPSAVAYVTEDGEVSIKRLFENYTNNEAEYFAVKYEKHIHGNIHTLFPKSLLCRSPKRVRRNTTIVIRPTIREITI